METGKERFSRYAAESVDWLMLEVAAKEQGATEIAERCEGHRKFCESQAELARPLGEMEEWIDKSKNEVSSLF